jgi:hypothetical protein
MSALIITTASIPITRSTITEVDMDEVLVKENNFAM